MGAFALARTSPEVARRFKVDLNYAGMGVDALGNPHRTQPKGCRFRLWFEHSLVPVAPIPRNGRSTDPQIAGFTRMGTPLITGRRPTTKRGTTNEFE